MDRVGEGLTGIQADSEEARLARTTICARAGGICEDSELHRQDEIDKHAESWPASPVSLKTPGPWLKQWWVGKPQK